MHDILFTKPRLWTGKIVTFRYSSKYNQHFENTSTLNSGFTNKTTKWRSICENCGLLSAGADCSERYFKNKDGGLSFLDEICTVYCSDM